MHVGHRDAGTGLPLPPTALAAVQWLRARLSSDAALAADSRFVRAGDAFLAHPGERGDGRAFIAQAVAAGAAAIVHERAGFAPDARHDVPHLAVDGLRALAGPIAAAWSGDPSARLRVVAITGTNGKTSCAQWLAEVLGASGRPCGVVGTLGPWGLTTPDPVTLQRAFAGFVQQGMTAAAIEASSIGLHQQRLAGTRIRTAVFTNLTRDHLDYHGDMAAYARAKAMLFAWPMLQSAVVNADDAHAPEMLAPVAAGVNRIAFTLQAPRSALAVDGWLRATRVAHLAAGTAIEIDGDFGRGTVEIAAIGRHNAQNALAVLGAALAEGVPMDAALSALARIAPVPGRLQPVVVEGAPLAVIDYAHTPDALANAIGALRPLADARGGRLWCVFGAGGDRDPGKRPLMGEVAERLADVVLLTSDNPRSESPQDILSQIAQGMRAAPHAIEPDRAAAITRVAQEAGPADVLLVAGKGHEDYQEVAGRKLPFSDVEVAHAALRDATSRKQGMFSLKEAAAAVRGARLIGDGATVITGVSTDTRTVAAGELFVALRGERFDGHAFVPQARSAGAAASLVDHWPLASVPADDGVQAGMPALVVEDTLAALGELAQAWRARFALPVIAVAGSNGKTTVKEMVASILAAAHGEAARLATRGNLNNEIGVPLTVFRLRSSHRAAVLELGMNHPGEIARLARIARPTVALVNNAQREHQEFMQSVEAVARENGAVIEALAADGVAVFPGDDAHAEVWRALAGPRRRVEFGLDARLDVSAAPDARPEGFEMRLPGGVAIQVALSIDGSHNVRNALAAAAAAHAAGIASADIAAGLAAFRPVAGRLVRGRAAGGAALIDDTYNANPDSVRAAIDVLHAHPGTGVLVLGDMGEVGERGPEFHREVGAYARERGVSHLLAMGPLAREAVAAFGTGAEHFDDVAPLAARAASLARPGATVLVKGSRFMRMERVVAALAVQGGH